MILQTTIIKTILVVALAEGFGSSSLPTRFLSRPSTDAATTTELQTTVAWTETTAWNSTGFSYHEYYMNTFQQRPFAVPLQQRARYQIFCDLDGVLVDFEHGIRSLFPNLKQFTSYHIPDLKRATMWKKVQEADAFFARLPWTRGGKRLWETIRPYNVNILTGVPTYQSSKQEKLQWCRRELGIPVHHIDKAGFARSHTPGKQLREGVCNVITCWSDNKHYESGPNAVLIDDRECLRGPWEARGGIFIHHDGDVERTISKLKALGIVPDES